MELEATAEKQEKEEAPDAKPGATEASDSPSAQGEGKESPLEVHGDQAQPGSATDGPQQHEERREQEEEEETHEKPAGESHPSAPVGGEDPDGLQDSSQQHEAQDAEESKQPEHKEAAVDGEIQVMAGSGEAAEEIAHPEEPELGKSPPSEVQSQELEAPDIKQERTE